MGMVDYTVHLAPKPDSLLRSSDASSFIERVEDQLKQKWTMIHVDTEAHQYLEGDHPLLFETDTALFQILLGVRGDNDDEVHVFLRFACCNPRDVYNPFLAVIAWLMQQFELDCYPMRPLPADKKKQVDTVISRPKDVVSLIPGMDYYRQLWQEMAGPEERKLRSEQVEIASFRK